MIRKGQLCKTNPYANGAPKMEASWRPEGSEGGIFYTFLSCFVGAYVTPRCLWMNRPDLDT